MKSSDRPTRFKHRSIFFRISQALKKTRLKAGGAIAIGADSIIMGSTPYLKTPRNGKVKVGSRTVINSDEKNSNIALTTRCKFVTGYEGEITIGDNCDLNGTCIVAYDSVSIGDFCQISSSTLITDTDFHPVDISERMKQMRGEKFDFSSVNKRPIRIGSNVWIGWGVTILKGATIGDNCIVAANSVVVGNSTFPDNCVIAGNPAKIVKMLK